MPDRFKKVVAGEPFKPSAAQWNAMIEATQKVLTAPSAPQAVTGGPGFYPTATIVNVHNDTENDVDQFGVLGISAPMFTDSEARKYSIAFSGVAPTLASHFGKFVVAAEPIVAGGVGSAFIGGLFPAKINVAHNSHAWADVINSSTLALQSRAVGHAKILWKEDGVGDEKLAYVLMCHAVMLNCNVKVTGNASGGGKYNGRIYIPGTSQVAATGNVAESDFGTLPSADDCLVVNGAEEAQSTHDLRSGTIKVDTFPGIVSPKASTGNLLTVYLTNYDWKQACS